MKFLKKMAIPTLLMAWSVYYIVDSMLKSRKGNTFVIAIFVILCVIYVIEFFGELCRARREKNLDDMKNETSSRSGIDNASVTKELFRSGVLLVCTLLYVWIMSYAGFILSTIIYLWGMFRFLKAKNQILALIATVALTVAMYLVFDELLNVPLPMGIFF